MQHPSTWPYLDGKEIGIAFVFCMILLFLLLVFTMRKKTDKNVFYEVEIEFVMEKER